MLIFCVTKRLKTVDFHESQMSAYFKMSSTHANGNNNVFYETTKHEINLKKKKSLCQAGVKIELNVCLKIQAVLINQSQRSSTCASQAITKIENSASGCCCTKAPHI